MPQLSNLEYHHAICVNEIINPFHVVKYTTMVGINLLQD
jgi:hypothetical protein